MEVDISELSDAQHNVILGVYSGNSDAKYYVPSTIVSLCVRGIAALHATGHICLSAIGRAMACKLDPHGVWAQ